MIDFPPFFYDLYMKETIQRNQIQRQAAQSLDGQWIEW